MTEQSKSLFRDLLDRKAIAADYGIPVTTQEVWHSTNRYGWRDLAIKVGRLVRYRREAVEQWLESRSIKNLAK